MYTTAAKVRAILPTQLINEDDLGVITGTSATLRYPAYDVPSILINGVLSTAFTFARPDAITLTGAASADRIIATVHTGIDDTDINAIITTVDRNLASNFISLPISGLLEDWSSMLSAARYLRMYATATEENMARAKALEEIVDDAILTYKKNSISYTVQKSNS